MSFGQNGYAQPSSAPRRIKYLIHEVVEQNIQGGASGQHYHITLGEYDSVKTIPKLTLLANGIYEPSMYAADYMTVADGDIVILSNKESISTSGASSGAAITSAMIVIYAAGASISGHKVVRSLFGNKVIHADKNTLSDAVNILGISTNSAIVSDPVSVVTSGKIEEVTWSWIVDSPIYLGNNGTLTQIMPTTGFLLIMGVATSPTSMLVNIKQAIAF